MAAVLSPFAPTLCVCVKNKVAVVGTAGTIVPNEPVSLVW